MVSLILHTPTGGNYPIHSIATRLIVKINFKINLQALFVDEGRICYNYNKVRDVSKHWHDTAARSHCRIAI